MVMKWVFVVLAWSAMAAMCDDSFDFGTAFALTASAGAIGCCLSLDMASRWEGGKVNKDSLKGRSCDRRDADKASRYDDK